MALNHFYIDLLLFSPPTIDMLKKVMKCHLLIVWIRIFFFLDKYSVKKLSWTFLYKPWVEEESHVYNIWKSFILINLRDFSEINPNIFILSYELVLLEN